MNAIELLKQDHHSVHELFTAHEKAGDRASVEKGNIAENIFNELDVHTRIEEEIFYPAARDGATGKTDTLVAEAYEEHEVAKNLIADLKTMTPGGEQWNAKMMVLKESIEHHVDEEENELFPQVRQQLGTTYLQELGEMMEARKRELTAPTGTLSGSLVKLVTRAYDSLTGNGKSAPRARRRPATAKKRVASRARPGSKARPMKKTATKSKARMAKRAAASTQRAAKKAASARKRATKARRSARR